MAENLLLSLKITLVGMGLVFGAILLLWGMITIIVRLTTSSRDENRIPSQSGKPAAELAHLAAIAAVTVALARQAKPAAHEFPLPATALVSAWQAVMRSDILKKRGSVR